MRLPNASRQASDWLGCGFYLTLATLTLMRAPEVGIFMLPILSLEIFAAIAFLIREPLKAAERTYRARLSAYCGTLLVLVYMLAARSYMPEWLAASGAATNRALGVIFWFGGCVWSAYAVWYLRRSFSIEPEARRLITGGPYGIARHPIYIGYLAQYLGIWMVYPGLPFAIVILVWGLFMLDRMRHEEKVLSRAFPEYADYRRKVGALGVVG